MNYVVLLDDHKIVAKKEIKMNKQVAQLTNYTKKNPIAVVIVATVAIFMIGVVAYSQSNSSSLQRKQVEADAKLTSQINGSEKFNTERVAKIATEKKAAEEAVAKKAAEEKAAVKAAADAEAKKQKTNYSQVSQNTSGTINLSSGTPIIYDGKSKIPVEWNAGFVSEKGFKLVWNNSGSPTYPGSDYQYLEKSSSSGSGYVKAFTSGTYYIRVCQYLGNGSCGTYSNQVVVTIP